MVRALACHAGDPGSIPGVCLYFILFLSHLEFKIASFGEPYYFGQTSYGIPPLVPKSLVCYHDGEID